MCLEGKFIYKDLMLLVLKLVNCCYFRAELEKTSFKHKVPHNSMKRSTVAQVVLLQHANMQQEPALPVYRT